MASATSGGGQRCPDCGALASLDAEWCGQCFRSLREPEPEPDPVPRSAGGGAPASAVVAPDAREPGAADASHPTWPCPACDHANPIEADACLVCGTTFATLMRQDEAPPQVDPKDALSASLLFPGLGHRKVGRGLDGFARGVLFTVLAAMAITVYVSGVHSAGTFGLFALFLGGALAVYLGTAYEAYRLAEGEGPLVSSRVLLWATVVVIIASVMLLAVSVVTVARR